MYTTRSTFALHVWIPLLVFVGVASLPSTRLTFTRHTSSQAWNDANAICRFQGGQLLEIQDSDRASLIATLFSSTYLSVWIGLHNPAESTPATWMWSSCSAFNSSYEQWSSGEPASQSSSFCAYYSSGSYYYSSPRWRSDDCSTPRDFICEKVDNCSFQLASARYGSSSVTLTFASDDPVTQCPSACLTVTSGGKECWAYDVSNTSCVLYFGADYLEATDPTDDVSVSVLIKDCSPLGVSNSDSYDASDYYGTELVSSCSPYSDATMYTVMEVAVTWQEAVNACTSLGQTLANFTTTSELDTLFNKMTSLSYSGSSQTLWVGFQEVADQAAWLDGSSVADELWDASYSAQANQSCGSASSSGLSLSQCSTRLPFVCQANRGRCLVSWNRVNNYRADNGQSYGSSASLSQCQDYCRSLQDSENGCSGIAYRDSYYSYCGSDTCYLYSASTNLYDNSILSYSSCFSLYRFYGSCYFAMVYRQNLVAAMPDSGAGSSNGDETFAGVSLVSLQDSAAAEPCQPVTSVVTLPAETVTTVQYVPQTPDIEVSTQYVTLTPQLVTTTHYVSVTPEQVTTTLQITCSPSVVTATEYITLNAGVVTATNYVTPPVDVVTTTEYVSLTPADVTVTEVVTTAVPTTAACSSEAAQVLTVTDHVTLPVSVVTTTEYVTVTPSDVTHTEVVTFTTEMMTSTPCASNPIQVVSVTDYVTQTIAAAASTAVVTTTEIVTLTPDVVTASVTASDCVVTSLYSPVSTEYVHVTTTDRVTSINYVTTTVSLTPSMTCPTAVVDVTPSLPPSSTAAGLSDVVTMATSTALPQANPAEGNYSTSFNGTVFQCQLLTKGPQDVAADVSRARMEMSVDRRETTVNKAKKISLPDGRTSAKNTGLTAVAICAVVFLLVFFIDLHGFLRMGCRLIRQ